MSSSEKDQCCDHRESAEPVVVHRPKPTVGGNFDLVDHFGHPVTERSYLGSYLLIFFGFTNCRTVCPAALSRIDEALHHVGNRVDQVQALYITVDPERDKPAVMRAFLKHRHPRIIGLTGSADAIESVKAKYHVFAQRTEDPTTPDGYLMPHSAFTYLVGPDGGYLTHFTDAVDASELAQGVLGFLPAPSNP
ncbi:SCO family protein [Streptomyces sp. NPDC096354]|uniref:SCO family protein n=1 Tax=Streptomyces sp. NPDC096354 TaxID=3366088 RepID=UPI0038086B9E